MKYEMSPKTHILFNEKIVAHGKCIADSQKINSVFGYKPFLAGARPPKSLEKDSEGNQRGFVPADDMDASARKAFDAALKLSQVSVFWPFALKGTQLAPAGIAIVTNTQLKFSAKEELKLS